MGKSTGQGALEPWMCKLKTTEIIANYNSPSYSGPAVKLGPGVREMLMKPFLRREWIATCVGKIGGLDGRRRVDAVTSRQHAFLFCETFLDSLHRRTQPLRLELLVQGRIVIRIVAWQAKWYCLDQTAAYWGVEVVPFPL